MYMDDWREGTVQRPPKKKKSFGKQRTNKTTGKDVTTWGARNVSRYLALARQKKFKKKKNWKRGLHWYYSKILVLVNKNRQKERKKKKKGVFSFLCSLTQK